MPPGVVGGAPFLLTFTLPRIHVLVASGGARWERSESLDNMSDDPRVPHERWEEPPASAPPVEEVKRKRGRPPGKVSDINERKEAVRRTERAGKKMRGLEADLEPIIDQQIRLVEWNQQTLTTEMTTGRAALQKFVTDDDMKKLAMVTKMVTDLGDLKIRWLAAAQKLGTGLTPAQVLDGAIGRIMSQPSDVRLKIIKKLIADHDELKKPGSFKVGHTAMPGTSRDDTPVTEDLARLLGEA